MAKNNKTDYFSHDCNARNDIKVLSLRIRHGAAGYGVFFMILERLRNEDGYKSVKDYNTLAFDFRVDASLVKSVVEDFGLFVFTEDGKYFYSDSFCNRMSIMDEIRVKRSKAAERRWKKQAEAQVAHDEQTVSDTTADNQEESHADEQRPAPVPRVAAQAEKDSTAKGNATQIISGDGNAKCLAKFFSKQSRANLDVVMMQFGMKPEDTDELRKLADAVVAEWNLSETTHQNYKDWASHLISTMRIKRSEQQRKPKSGKEQQQTTQLQQPEDYSYTGGFGSQDI